MERFIKLGDLIDGNFNLNEIESIVNNGKFKIVRWNGLAFGYGYINPSDWCIGVREFKEDYNSICEKITRIEDLIVNEIKIRIVSEEIELKPLKYSKQYVTGKAYIQLVELDSDFI